MKVIYWNYMFVLMACTSFMYVIQIKNLRKIYNIVRNLSEKRKTKLNKLLQIEELCGLMLGPEMTPF